MLPRYRTTAGKVGYNNQANWATSLYATPCNDTHTWTLKTKRCGTGSPSSPTPHRFKTGQIKQQHTDHHTALHAPARINLMHEGKEVDKPATQLRSWAEFWYGLGLVYFIYAEVVKGSSSSWNFGTLSALQALLISGTVFQNKPKPRFFFCPELVCQ